MLGSYENKKLIASVCLRERRDNSLCLDMCNALESSSLFSLLDKVINTYSHKRLECFVKTDSDLHHYLTLKGFYVPDFFTKIGPLVELRNGEQHNIGSGQYMRTLSWI